MSTKKIVITFVIAVFAAWGIESIIQQLIDQQVIEMLTWVQQTVAFVLYAIALIVAGLIVRNKRKKDPGK